MRLSATTRIAGAAALLAAAGLGGCVKTPTYGTGQSPELAIFREVTGGFLAPDKEEVTYQPRAPLVLPPSTGALPSPAPAADTAVAQWPDDPDQRAAPRKQFGGDNPESEVSSAEYRRLKPLARLARATPRPQRARERDDRDPVMDMVRSKQQREEFRAAVDEAEGVGGERRFLTDPPDTVREPAATAPQQFEEIEKKKKGNFFTRLFRG